MQRLALLLQRRWRYPLLILGSGSLALTLASGLAAQPPVVDQPPTVPETRVEVTRPPVPTTPAPELISPPPSPVSPDRAFTSPPIQGYKADSSTTGTRIDVPNLSFPGTTSVISRDLIQDQQMLRTDDFIRNVPGAIKVNDFRRPDAFNLRGFEIRARDFRKNGFLDPTPGPRDLANIDRIEILQGPASVLYGSGQPAGVVNFLTKKPLETEKFLNGRITAGSFGLFRTEVDVNDSVFGSDKLFGRFNFAYENVDGFRDFSFNERVFFAPSLLWKIDDDTSMTFEVEYLNDRRRFDSGVVAYQGQVGVIPIRRFLNEPNDFQRFEEFRITTFFNHRLNEDWSFRVGGFFVSHDSPSTGTVPVSTGAPFGLPDNIFFRQRQEIDPFREQYYSMIADLTGNVCTFGIKHQLLFGTELGFFESNDFTARFSNFTQAIPLPPPFFFGLIPTSPINIFNPVYGLPQPSTAGGGLFDSKYSKNRYGFYTQDLIELTPQLKVLAGVRYDIADLHFEREFQPVTIAPGFPGPGFPRTTTDDTYYRLTPRVGFVYEPLEKVASIYGSYSQSFDPPPGGPYVSTQPLRPETGEAYEFGTKWELIESALSVQVAWFHIEKQNVVVQQNNLFATQIGTQRSQGVETSVVGNITDQWSIIANYSYVDSRILEDGDPTIVGNRFRGIPYNTASIWSRYNIIQTNCEVLGLAAGMVAVGSRPGDLQASFNLPSYVRWDAGVFYQRNRMNVGVYLENLFDREYYVGSLDSFSVFPGAPLTVRASVGWSF